MAIFHFLKDHERIARFKWGIFEGIKGPGRVWLLPVMHSGIKVDLRPQVIAISNQRHVTNDNIGVDVDGLLHVQVIAEHAHRAVLNLLDYRSAVTGLTTDTLRTVIGDVDVNEMASPPEFIGNTLMEKLNAETERWGIRILNVELREIKPTCHAEAIKHEKAQQTANEYEEKRLTSQDGPQTIKASTQAQCTALRNIGIDAQILDQNPFTSLAAAIWIEIADGPIRWAAVGDPEAWELDVDDWQPEWTETVCFVPDSRVKAGLPSVLIEPYYESEGARWEPCDDLQNNEKGFSQRVAEKLTRDLEREILMSCPRGLHVRSDTVRGCWAIWEPEQETEWTKSLWNIYRTVGEALLAMSIPIDE